MRRLTTSSTKASWNLNNNSTLFELSYPIKQVNITMKTHHSTIPFRIALMIGALALAFTACKKSPDTIGNDLISENDYITIGHTDTLTMVCYSYLDTIGTKNVASGLLGSMNDPVFGRTQAGICTQFRFSAAGQLFGTEPIVDSIVLQLCVSGYYGDTMVNQTLHVYELADTLSSTVDYYNNTDVAIGDVDYANNFTFQPRPHTKTHVIGGDTIPQSIIRVPLSNTLGEYLIHLDSTAYKEPATFKTYFYGLCLRCDPVDDNGSVSYISLTNNSYTLMQLYYHAAATPEKPLRYDYYVTSSDTYFNQISHDYTYGDNEFRSQVLDGDTTLGQQRVYLQTMGGVRTKIFFPTLTHWADTLAEGTHIIINEAKLIVPAASVDTAVYTAPSNLSLLYFKSDGTSSILPDFYEGTSYYGGTYSNMTHSAMFRISEYLQDLLMGKEPDCGLSLGINGGSYNAQRMVVNGPEMESNPIRVEMTYSVVKE